MAFFPLAYLPNGTNVCFHGFLWSSPSTCLPICLRPGGRGGRKQIGRQAEGFCLFGCGPLLKTFVPVGRFRTDIGTPSYGASFLYSLSYTVFPIKHYLWSSSSGPFPIGPLLQGRPLSCRAFPVESFVEVFS